MQFIPTPNQTVTRGRQVDLLVLHTMEAAEKGDTAEAISHFFARSSTKASAHYCIDSDSVVQCVLERDVAWAAPGANHDGVQLEHAGFARQNAQGWADTYSTRMLALSAHLAAAIVRRHSIPVTFLRAPDLAAGRRGITTHNEVSRAFGLSDHWDPGPAFPIQQYLIAILGSSPKPTPAKPTMPRPPTLRRGASGWRVKQAQKLLRAAGGKLTPDGVFGPRTEAATKTFQRRAGLVPDGVIGPLTWKALWQHRYVVA